MSPKSSGPQAASSVSQVLMSDTETLLVRLGLASRANADFLSLRCARPPYPQILNARVQGVSCLARPLSVQRDRHPSVLLYSS